MTAPDYPSHNTVERGQDLKPSKNLTAIEILNPEPVSKWNLYVLIGCAALVVLLILLGPWLYPYVEDFTSTAWEQFK
ncbi:hypothetical protein N24_2290 [Corynebacterium suranareeae]|uniref:Uncharacterized protein n=1 Tax=Corynebacterium suranareeae TaxID=2506452 RepID=A0A169S0T8_9CORY|nr:hypothetical protein [Corynebacterium suranareeae]BAU96552.1 hypothetical protein N24_2290 [Corynebacterium suranareeae]